MQKVFEERFQARKRRMLFFVLAVLFVFFETATSTDCLPQGHAAGDEAADFARSSD
jgi:hypothetical protein